MKLFVVPQVNPFCSTSRSAVCRFRETPGATVKVCVRVRVCMRLIIFLDNLHRACIYGCFCVLTSLCESR
jgi:hypothetical protein